ncbi:VOC family protein [Paenibacillus riograndensis]|uniref:Lactoylglutathione lyase n=2 Tax=Paenibacillus riograndensis TaxID=483937 RepID=A0A132U8V7_9BACL|nr:VOC family protein [Paenibacillus riograndensis]KWX79783.1 lactoylglutathione lyase [Paenibacillus riograndensis]KWX85816.1 lactoylglutathione lyase [Paenibacillus riograndensis]CQR54233.1 methylmalonyl-CoA epimerase [Paenibacillus riograndensis SBR5]
MSGWLGNHVITQIGILVNDIEKVSGAYADFFGLEKPDIVVTDTADLAQTRYNGGATEARAKLAFFDMGSLQLELIEPDHHPSTWRDYLNEHGEGPHHIAFVVEGMKEKIMLLEGKGFPLQQKGEYTGGRYAYMDTFKELKVLVELLENDNN